MIKKIMNTMESVAVFILLILSAVVLLQVLLRNIFGTGFVWGEEASRFLLLSMVLISAPVVFNEDGHVAFDIIQRRLSPTWQYIQKIFISLLIVGFYLFYIISHIKLMKNCGDVLSPSLRMPNTIFFSAGIIGAILGITAGIGKIVAIVGEKRK